MSHQAPYRDVHAWRRLAPFPVLMAVAIALSACNTASLTGTAPAPQVVIPPAPPVAVNVALLPGKWGLASYRDEKDRPRTEKEAKAACGNPYVIGQGPGGGVLMYLADQSKPSEVFVKTMPDGRSLIGPRGAPGMKQDRIVLFFQNGVLVADWLDPSVKERYGTMVFVRCA